MIRIVCKCPDCGKKPWIRPDGFGGFIMGCCRTYTKYPTEVETRSTWNESVMRKLGSMPHRPATEGCAATTGAVE